MDWTAQEKAHKRSTLCSIFRTIEELRVSAFIQNKTIFAELKRGNFSTQEVKARISPLPYST
jgi:hypothetical protein